jgi:hypothetical protein
MTPVIIVSLVLIVVSVALILESPPVRSSRSRSGSRSKSNSECFSFPILTVILLPCHLLVQQPGFKLKISGLRFCTKNNLFNGIKLSR